MENKSNTMTFSIRVEANTVNALDAFAKAHEWSRNYVIGKFLKEKIYELSGDSA